MAEPMRHLPPFHLGDRIRKARLTAGFSSVKAFAAVVGIDRDTLAKYEAGERTPRTIYLDAIARATGFSAAELRGEDGPDGGSAQSPGGDAAVLDFPGEQDTASSRCIERRAKAA